MTATTFQLPGADELPPPAISLNALIAFANRFDPTRWLEGGIWQANFAAKACETWQHHWARFKAGDAPPPSPLLLLFTLNYDIVSGANLYRREHGAESFHRWLLAGLAQSTVRPRSAARAFRWPEDARVVAGAERRPAPARRERVAA